MNPHNPSPTECLPKGPPTGPFEGADAWTRGRRGVMNHGTDESLRDNRGDLMVGAWIVERAAQLLAACRSKLPNRSCNPAQRDRFQISIAVIALGALWGVRVRAQDLLSSDLIPQATEGLS